MYARDAREERRAVLRVVDRAEHRRRGDRAIGLEVVQVALHDRGTLAETARAASTIAGSASTPE